MCIYACQSLPAAISKVNFSIENFRLIPVMSMQENKSIGRADWVTEL